MPSPLPPIPQSATHPNRRSDSRYQGLTYLGADNAIPAREAPPGPTTAFDFLAAAAEAARTPPPSGPVPQTPADEGPGSEARGGSGSPSENAAAAGAVAFAGAGVVAVVDGDAVVRSLEELEERAAGEACTPAGAAQALARVACRLYDLADDLGGE